MDLSWMLAPVAACVVMALALGWFGFHVLQREVVFVDLALAQVAALGTTYAVFLGHSPDEPIAYVLGLVATILGAAAFSFARRFSERVPQEALIGISYAVSAGGSALLLDFASDPHGAEKLQHLLVGNVAWVSWNEILAMTAVCGVVGLIHAALGRRFLEISIDPAGAAERGEPIAALDLVFYLSFGLVITTVVHVAGVLLVFTWLVVPAVIARLFVDRVPARLALGYAVSIPASVVGVAVSYEHAAGPIIVGLLGACLAVALVVWTIARSVDRRWTLAWLVGAGVGLTALGWAFSAVDVGGEHAHGHEEGLPAVPGPAGVERPDASAREAFYRQNAASRGVLEAALADEDDDSLRLLLGALLVKAADTHGLEVLAALCASSEVPFVRMEADALLRAALGEAAPGYDPLAGRDQAGVWKTVAGAPPPGWEARAVGVEIP